MPEIGQFLFEQLGAAALIIFFGFLADYFSTPEFRREVALWISRKSAFDLRAQSIRSVLTAFLDGFLYRIFGSRLFSLQFFVRSCGISLMFFCVAIAIQAIYFPHVSDELITSDNYAIGAVLIGALVISNLCIDYLSNVQTISLLRMAAGSGRLLDVLVVFFADISLTVTLFTLLFPIGIVGGAIFAEIIRPPTAVSLKLVTPNIFDDVQLPFIEKNQQLKKYTVEFSLTRQATHLVAPVIFRTLAVGIRDESSVISNYAEIIKSNSAYFKSESKTEQEWLVKIKRRGLPLNSLAIRTLYYSAYRRANITRDEFLGVLQLEPLVIPLASVYSGMEVYYAGYRIPDITVKCIGGEIKAVTESDNLGCKPSFGVFYTRGPEKFWDEREVLAGVDHFPISPFFFTSFATSMLYYFAIVLVGLGILAMRGLSRVFSTQRLENSTKPFALLSVILFVLVESVILLVRLA
jgi:hypothetical protein